ncbi:38397_t:CDS:2, partial [Gigaspora margarita]
AEDKTCIKVVEYFHANSEHKEWKKILDSIKKDLKKVIKSTFGFDVTRKRKAQRIIDNWKILLILYLYFDDNWIAPINNPNDRAQFKIGFQQSNDHDEEIKHENDDSLNLLEQSIEVSSNDQDVETTYEDGDNPFIANTGENSIKYK